MCFNELSYITIDGIWKLKCLICRFEGLLGPTQYKFSCIWRFSSLLFFFWARLSSPTFLFAAARTKFFIQFKSSNPSETKALIFTEKTLILLTGVNISLNLVKTEHGFTAIQNFGQNVQPDRAMYQRLPPRLWWKPRSGQFPKFSGKWRESLHARTESLPDFSGQQDQFSAIFSVHLSRGKIFSKRVHGRAATEGETI